MSKNNKPRNYTKKFMIQKGIGKTKVIPNKKKNSSTKLSTKEYLEEYEDELNEDLYYELHE